MLSAKLLALSMFVVGLCLTSSFGQAKAALQLSDLAGQWELVAARSTMRKGAKYSSGAITISVRGDEVRLKRTLESEESATERDLAYFADGRGESNVWIVQDGTREVVQETTTRWKKNTLSIKSKNKSNMGWFSVEERYELSKDGKTLAYEMVAQIVQAGMTRPADSVQRLVFRKI